MFLSIFRSKNSNPPLVTPAAGQSVHLIGGADAATELDAKRRINHGSRVAAEL